MGTGPPQSGEPSATASMVTTRLLAVAISLPILSTVATILRFYARRLKNDDRPRPDDWAIVVALFFCYVHSINTLVAAGIGGVNTITVPPQVYVNIALRALFIASFLLITALYVVKIAILLFYYQLFAVSQRFKKAVIAMCSILSLWWLLNIILDLLHTNPLDAAWKDAARAHHRFSFNNWYLAYSGFSIFFDIVILCFPLPMIKSLRVNSRQKISILAIFWLGAFVCVSAIIRFVLFYKYAYRLSGVGRNDYSLLTNSFIWAEVEPNTSVIAACLPAYGPLFREGGIFPRLLSTGSRGSHRDQSLGYISNPISARLSNRYYEFDRTISSKGQFEMYGDADKKKTPVGPQESGKDVEAQYELERSKDSIPKAWIP